MKENRKLSFICYITYKGELIFSNEPQLFDGRICAESTHNSI